MNEKLQTLYNLFKPMENTVVWSNNKDELCVGFDGYYGWVRYYIKDDDALDIQFINFSPVIVIE